jgi:hypothetical protein
MAMDPVKARAIAFAIDHEHWWNMRSVGRSEIQYAIQLGYEAGWRDAEKAKDEPVLIGHGWESDTE